MHDKIKIPISQFLAAFFPDEEETIWFASFKPKGAEDNGSNHPARTPGSRAEIQKDTFQRKLKEINQHSGMYFVVNAGGNEDKDIKRFNAFFVENDGPPIDEQQQALNGSPLLPSIRVQTKKSIHAYWLIEGDCSEVDWRDIQKRLIQYFKSDAKIKNLSRVMRVPYFNHLSLNGGEGYHKQKVELIHFEPDTRFSVDDMKAAFEPVIEEAFVPSAYTYSSTGYPTWEALAAEARTRIQGLPGAKRSGIWIHAKGVCHDGKGDTGIAFNSSTGAYFCQAGCTTAHVLSMLGLPEKPDKVETYHYSTTLPVVSKPRHAEAPPEIPFETETDNSVGIFRSLDLAEKTREFYKTGRQPGESPGWFELEKLYTVKKKQLTIITGFPSSGKSAVLDAILVNLAISNDWHFGICSMENQPLEQHVSSILELYTGQPFSNGPTERMSKETMEDGLIWMQKHFTFLLPPDDHRTVSGILKIAKRQHLKEKLDGIVIDPWNELEHRRPIGMNESEYTSLALSKIREFGRAEDLHMWLVAHPTKVSKDKNGNFPRLTLNEISGSAHFRNKADFGIVVSRDTETEGAPSVVDVQKVRFRWCGKIGKCELYFDTVTGRYGTSPGIYTTRKTKSRKFQIASDEMEIE